MNHIIVSGNLTRDAKVFDNENSSTYLFSIAHNSRERNSSGEYEDVTTFYNVRTLAYGGQVGWYADALVKGAKVVVSGSLSFEDYEGTPQPNIFAREIEFFQGSRTDDDEL